MEQTFKERQEELSVFVKGTAPFNKLNEVRDLAISADERIEELKHSVRDLTKTIQFLRKTEKFKP